MIIEGCMPHPNELCIGSFSLTCECFFAAGRGQYEEFHWFNIPHVYTGQCMKQQTKKPALSGTCTVKTTPHSFYSTAKTPPVLKANSTPGSTKIRPTGTVPSTTVTPKGRPSTANNRRNQLSRQTTSSIDLSDSDKDDIMRNMSLAMTKLVDSMKRQEVALEAISKHLEKHHGSSSSSNKSSKKVDNTIRVSAQISGGLKYKCIPL